VFERLALESPSRSEASIVQTAVDSVPPSVLLSSVTARFNMPGTTNASAALLLFANSSAPSLHVDALTIVRSSLLCNSVSIHSAACAAVRVEASILAPRWTLFDSVSVRLEATEIGLAAHAALFVCTPTSGLVLEEGATSLRIRGCNVSGHFRGVAGAKYALSTLVQAPLARDVDAASAVSALSVELSDCSVEAHTTALAAYLG
jgi:hypothetical protein